METDKLKHTLQQLNDHLTEAETRPQGLDEESRRMLQNLSAQVQQILQHSSWSSDVLQGEPVSAQRQSLLDHLLSVTEEFEESHPRLAETIGQLATALSRIGI